MVLTTTRSNDVALTMRAYSVHNLSELYKDDSWSLFKQIAFEGWLPEEASALEAAGLKIVEKCKGVPLAIKSIAGILSKKRNNIQGWKNIEQSELWDDVQDHEILPSLKLSYNYLSPMLKKCFSISTFFPKGISFEKYDMICRWMALGLIRNSSNGNKTMEDNGEEYLNELLSISFLTVERNELGEESRYIMHDLVYDLARSISIHERLYLEDGYNKNEVPDIQHLTVCERVELTPDFPNKMVLEKIRSFDMCYNFQASLLMHVKFLRVLLIGCSGIEEVPQSIATLRCLKFLDLSGNPIKVLSNCITKLYNLQSLFFYECKPLIKIPEGLSNLVNLRHLGSSFHLCPTEEGVIRQLNQLQTVPPLQLSEGGFQISELGPLHHIKGTLDIKGLELIKSKSDAEKSKLSKKPRVEQLRLTWDNDDDFIKHEEVLGGLHPSPNLKLLSIRGYGGEKFPSWLMKMNVSEDHNNENAGILRNLIKIELVDCGRCQQLPMLGHLPSLKVIEIRNMEKLEQIGPEFYGGADLLSGDSNQASSSGSSVHEMSKGVGKLEEWWESSPEKWNVFPSLEVLVIEGCMLLRKVPNKFPNLRELIVKGMISSQPLDNILSNKSSLSCLKKLDIQGILGLTDIPEEVGECTSLHTLIIKDCHLLMHLPNTLLKLLSLEVLVIWRCPNLTSVPNLSCLGCLRELHLYGNDELVNASEGLESCKSLEELTVASCGKVETLPDLAGLSRLRELHIMGMTKMISSGLPDWVYNLPCLRILGIGSYEELNEFPDISCLFKITSLQSLVVYGWAKLQSLPEQLQQFTALKALSICDFENVEQLPDWLGNLTSLEGLHLGQCEKLKKLPSKEALDRLTNFRYLEIQGCPLLEEDINKFGAEYRKIASHDIQFKIIDPIT